MKKKCSNTKISVQCISNKNAQNLCSAQCEYFCDLIFPGICLLNCIRTSHLHSPAASIWQVHVVPLDRSVWATFRRSGWRSLYIMHFHLRGTGFIPNTKLTNKAVKRKTHIDYHSLLLNIIPIYSPPQSFMKI